jgi:hypothetical protein
MAHWYLFLATKYSKKLPKSTIDYCTSKKLKTIFATSKPKMVVVAQLVRALDCGSRGRGFKSHLPPKKKSTQLFVIQTIGFLVFISEITPDCSLLFHIRV